MIPNQSRNSVPHAAYAIALLCAVSIGLGACASAKVSTPRTQDPQRLSHADFVDRNAETDASIPTAPEPSPDAGGSVLTGAPAEAADGVDRTEPEVASSSAATPIANDDGITLSASSERASAPEDSAAPANRPASPTNGLRLLDAKVGDVNGKPIFTNSFFEPIEDRLIAEAERLPINEWRESVARIIAARLDGIIADELLRAEAMAALTPNQRVGLQAFMGNFRENLLSENLGSSQLATRRLLEQQGITLDEALRQKEIDTLVQLTLIKEINRGVNVSWRDIKLRYEQDIDEFSPPPTAVLRVIRAFKDDTETIEQITTQLSDGEDFVKIAAGPLNNYNTDAHGMHTALISDTFETTEFFGPAVLNEATSTLSIGESVGPVELGSSVYWIKLMDIQQESVSLYDAQLKIQRDLTFERREEAKNQYFQRLQERARVSTRDEVLLRLFGIAEERYAPRR
ncbi:MAG: hypothetical protein WD114_05875 [Phycisphaerales bacterium]